MVLGGVGRIDTTDAGVEATAEDGRQTSLLEAVFVGPLPGILEVCLVLRFVVRRVEIVTAACQTGVHDGQVLIGQGEVDHELRLVVREKSLQLLHIVGIHLSGGHSRKEEGGRRKEITLCLDSLHDLVAFFFAAAGDHKVGKHVCILCNLECCYRRDASSANH